MLKNINLFSVVLAVCGFTAAYFTVTGDVQKVITFQDPLNEIFFFFVSLLGGITGVITTKKFTEK